jgi:ectoine hydroxylase-related dioxygenase (phytanoyl-CoA dioxygenase family)
MRQRDNYVHASAADSSGALTDQQVAQWQDEGYTFVSGVVPAATIEALRSAAEAQFPKPGSPEAREIADFGSAGAFTFPSEVQSFNALTLDESLLDAVAQLLETTVENLRLTQSDLWPKYGRDEHKGIQDNSDQRIHVDYPNHTIAHPTPWHRPEAVEMIIYLSDESETGGATAVVPRQGRNDPAYRWPIVDSPGIGDLRYVNDRTSAENYFAEQRPELADWRKTLYSREMKAAFKPGDILFYRHDTWHRGTPMKNNALRLVQNLTFRLAEAEWISTLHVGWAWKAYRNNKFLEKLIATSSLKQRAVMGFPQPGSAFWCEETIDAVTARYGMFGFDPAPYRADVSGRQNA